VRRAIQKQHVVLCQRLIKPFRHDLGHGDGYEESKLKFPPVAKPSGSVGSGGCGAGN